MTIHIAIMILDHHNKWRRGEMATMPYTPTELGTAIEMVLKYANRKLEDEKSSLFTNKLDFCYN
jgi:hypothetical protein